MYANKDGPEVQPARKEEKLRDRKKKNKSSIYVYTNLIICDKIKKFFPCCFICMELQRYAV